MEDEATEYWDSIAREFAENSERWSVAGTLLAEAFNKDVELLNRAVSKAKEVQLENLLLKKSLLELQLYIEGMDGDSTKH